MWPNPSVKRTCLRLSFDDFANQIEIEWQFRVGEDKLVTVLVEWPQSSRFANAIIANLSQVSAKAVREAIARRGEGRWSVAQAAAHA